MIFWRSFRSFCFWTLQSWKLKKILLQILREKLNKLDFKLLIFILHPVRVLLHTSHYTFIFFLFANHESQPWKLTTKANHEAGIFVNHFSFNFDFLGQLISKVFVKHQNRNLEGTMGGLFSKSWREDEEEDTMRVAGNVEKYDHRLHMTRLKISS